MIYFHTVGFRKTLQRQKRSPNVVSLWLGVEGERTLKNGIAMEAKATTKPVDYGYY